MNNGLLLAWVCPPSLSHLPILKEVQREGGSRRRGMNSGMQWTTFKLHNPIGLHISNSTIQHTTIPIACWMAARRRQEIHPLTHTLNYSVIQRGKVEINYRGYRNSEEEEQGFISTPARVSTFLYSHHTLFVLTTNRPLGSKYSWSTHSARININHRQIGNKDHQKCGGGVIK